MMLPFLVIVLGCVVGIVVEAFLLKRFVPFVFDMGPCLLRENVRVDCVDCFDRSASSEIPRHSRLLSNGDILFFRSRLSRPRTPFPLKARLRWHQDVHAYSLEARAFLSSTLYFACICGLIIFGTARLYSRRALGMEPGLAALISIIMIAGLVTACVAFERRKARAIAADIVSAIESGRDWRDRRGIGRI